MQGIVDLIFLNYILHLWMFWGAVLATWDFFGPNNLQCILITAYTVPFNTN